MDKPVGDMTREELRQFVLDVVHSDASMPETVEINGIRMLVRSAPPLSKEVFATAARLRFKPDDGIEGVLADLRADRDDS
jgi:hypothetical protein